MVLPLFLKEISQRFQYVHLRLLCRVKTQPSNAWGQVVIFIQWLCGINCISVDYLTGGGGHKVRFPEGLIYEDEFVSYKLFYLAKQVSMVKEVLYYYYQREGSIVHSFKYKRLSMIEKIILEYFRWAEKDAPDMIDLVRFASIRFLNGSIWEYVRGEYNSQDKAILERLNNVLIKRSGNFFFNPYANFKLKKNYLLMRLHILIWAKRIEWKIKNRKM